MPLIYNSLDSEHPEVQERGLKTVPSLLDVLDVGSIQEVLFVKVAVRLSFFFVLLLLGTTLITLPLSLRSSSPKLES